MTLDPGKMQRALGARFTRRSMLRGAGTGVAAFSLARFAAACGGSGASGSGGSGSGSAVDPATLFTGEAGPLVNFANWPLYIDQKKVDGEITYPSLEAFTAASGIDVNYEAVIQSNQEFYGKIQPQLAAGDDAGWDIIVITEGRHFTLLTRNEWVLPLDHTKTPNFNANAASYAVDPDYDPGNRYSMAWQSGLTGIGVNRDLVNGEITSLDDLANPAKVGLNSVGMITAEMPDCVMIHLGIDPATSGPDEWREARDWLVMQRESGTVRKYFDQGYVDDFTAGNLAATQAWSGDVLYYKLWAGYENLDFVFPDNGALLWIDNMMIPRTAANPVGALQVMDWVYQPDIATFITEWVLYMSPVDGVRELIQADSEAARAEGATKYADKLAATAGNENLFPSDELLGRTRFRYQIQSDEQAAEWDSIFLPISQG
ncbi:MAG: spermidine/putrescine ABC transporter substrate-binding protein [Actinomycetota bacterium]